MKRRHRRQQLAPTTGWRNILSVVGDTAGATNVIWVQNGEALAFTMRGKRYTLRCRHSYNTSECRLLTVHDV